MPPQPLLRLVPLICAFLSACTPASPERRMQQAVAYERNVQVYVVAPDDWEITDGTVAPVFKITLANLGPRTIKQLTVRGELKGGTVYRDVTLFEPLLTNKYHAIPGKGGYLQFDFAFAPKKLTDVEQRLLPLAKPEYTFRLVEMDY